MSSLSEQQMAKLEFLFEMENGGVLGFDSHKKLKNYIITKTDIDIEKGEGYVDQASRAKKFRYFLQHESDNIVGPVLLDMLEKRHEIVERRFSGEPDKYEKFASEIENVARAMSTGTELPQNNQKRDEYTLLPANEVFKDIIDICEKVCNNKTYTYAQSENAINDYFRDMLSAKGYLQVMDQTRHGSSASGKDAGEIDILLKKDDKEIAIIEGLKLACVDTSCLKNHIDKALTNYNALGTPTFIIAYVGVADFKSFWDKTYEYLDLYNYPVNVEHPLQELSYPNAAVRTAQIMLSKDGYGFPMYFIAVKINEK